MRIENIETYVLRYKIDKTYGGCSKGMPKERSALLIKIITDNGIEGWGEAGQTSHPEFPQVIIRELFADFLIGKDPWNTEKIWEDLYDLCRDYGQKGPVIEALSGIDIALWDIKGKTTKLPVYKLLGGKFRDRIMAYPCGLYHRECDNLIEILVKEAKQYVEQGFKAIKMKIGGRSPEEDFRTIKAIRETVGEEVKLMADANHAYNAYTAIKVGKELEKYNFSWFEEPVPPEDIEGYLRIKEILSIPIAGGECEYTRFGFKNLISKRAVDIVQPDVSTAGGFTECKKIAAIANTWGVQCIPHVWASAVGLAAAIQLIASLPNCPSCHYLFPFYQEPVLEFDCNPNPLRKELISIPFTAREGFVEIPTKPGLGIDIEKSVLKKYLAS